MDENVKYEHINVAINKLSELTGEDFHGYRSEVWNVLLSLISTFEYLSCCSPDIRKEEAEYRIKKLEGELRKWKAPHVIVGVMGLILFGCDCGGADKTRRIEMERQAVDSCIQQGGVPILDDWGRMKDCKFPPARVK